VLVTDKWVWGTGGRILTGQNQSTQKNALPSANLPKIPYGMAWNRTSASTL